MVLEGFLVTFAVAMIASLTREVAQGDLGTIVTFMVKGKVLGHDGVLIETMAGLRS